MRHNVSIIILSQIEYSIWHKIIIGVKCRTLKESQLAFIRSILLYLTFGFTRSIEADDKSQDINILMLIFRCLRQSFQRRYRGSLESMYLTIHVMVRHRIWVIFILVYCSCLSPIAHMQNHSLCPPSGFKCIFFQNESNTLEQWSRIPRA